MSLSDRPRILSGVQSSGKLHIGNYFGAIKQHIERQDSGDCFYFIADYHALTTLKEAEEKEAGLAAKNKSITPRPARQILSDNIHDAALDHVATIVRGADTSRPDLTPQCEGLLAISYGLSSNFSDDHEMLKHGMVMYDALYAWCRLQLKAK